MKSIIPYIIIFLGGFSLGAVVYKHNFQPTPIIEYVPYETTNTHALKELVLTKEILRKTQDSLNAYKSDTTISEELFVAKYKLERIRYYTKIVDKNPKNLKFYKGWIKRVLE